MGLGLRNLGFGFGLVGLGGIIRVQGLGLDGLGGF